MGICVSCRRRDRKPPEKRSGVGLGAGGPAKGPAAAELLPRRVDYLPAMANSISNIKMTNPIKGIVSKRRKRYIKDGFNLDLAYITDRLIAMGFPAEKLEGVYRNHIDEVYRFLEQMHKDHYKIYNLCSERSYDTSKFQGRVERYAFEDHTPPNMELIQPFCEDVHKWLSEDSRNVAAVHCKAGKGRTGTMVCCYLLYSGQKATADEALQFYGTKRTHDEKGVTIPSQRRYVEYYAALVRSGLQYAHTAVYIRELVMCPPPMLNGGQCTLELTVSQAQPPFKAPHGCHEVRKHARSVRVCLTHCTPLHGDVRVDVYNKPKMMMRKEKLFHFWFNTFFLVCEVGAQRVPSPADSPNQETYKLTLNKWQLDDAHKDKQHKLYSPDFKVELIVQKQPESSTFSSRGARAPSPPSSSASSCSEPPALGLEPDLDLAEHWDSGEPPQEPRAVAARAHCALGSHCAANTSCAPATRCAKPYCAVGTHCAKPYCAVGTHCAPETRCAPGTRCAEPYCAGGTHRAIEPPCAVDPHENSNTTPLLGCARGNHSSTASQQCDGAHCSAPAPDPSAICSCKRHVHCRFAQQFSSDTSPPSSRTQHLLSTIVGQEVNDTPALPNFDRVEKTSDAMSRCKHCETNLQSCHIHAVKDNQVNQSDEVTKKRSKPKYKSSKYTMFDNPSSNQNCSAADSDDPSTQCSYKQDCIIRLVGENQPYKELVYQLNEPISTSSTYKQDTKRNKQNCDVGYRGTQASTEPDYQPSDLVSAQSSRTQSPQDAYMDTDQAQSPNRRDPSEPFEFTEPSYKNNDISQPDFFQGKVFADKKTYRSTVFQTDLTLDQNYIRLDDPSHRTHWGPDVKDRDYSEDHMFFDFSGNHSTKSTHTESKHTDNSSETNVNKNKPHKLKYITDPSGKHNKSPKSKFDKFYRTYPEPIDHPTVPDSKLDSKKNTDPNIKTKPKPECPPDMFLKADKTFSPNFKTDSKNYIKFTCIPPNNQLPECNYKPGDPYNFLPDRQDQAYPNITVMQEFNHDYGDQNQSISRALTEPCCKADKPAIKSNYNLLAPPDQPDNRTLSKPRLSLTASWKEFSGKFSDNRKKRDKD